MQPFMSCYSWFYVVDVLGINLISYYLFCEFNYVLEGLPDCLRQIKLFKFAIKVSSIIVQNIGY
jgi:hypothetical protein